MFQTAGAMLAATHFFVSAAISAAPVLEAFSGDCSAIPKTRSQAGFGPWTTQKSLKVAHIAVTARICILYRDFSARSDTRFRPCCLDSINLGLRRDVPAGILKANGANQKARQSLTGGLVVARLPVYLRVYGGAGAYLELVHHGP